jgi:hypothetical protein
MIIQESEYQGKPVLIIKNDENDRFPFSFGVSKAKKILDSIDAIRAFVEKNNKPAEA